MKKIFSFLMMMVLLFGTINAQSNFIWGDSFEYVVGTTLTDNGWTAHSAGGTNAITVSSGALEYLNYDPSGVGNKVTLTTSGEDINHPFPANVTSGIVYAAFMVNVTSAKNAGDYFAHFSNSSDNFFGRVFAKSNGTGYQLGITKSTSNVVYADQTLDFGTTYLVVMKYEIVSGATNDIVSLFLNPIVGNSEPSTPAATVTEDSTDPANLAKFALRQGSASNAPELAFDGIRVATTWAEAVKMFGSSLPTVATPTFDPPTGVYYNVQNVTINCDTEGATIHYTTNGDNPTTSSPVYSTPIPVSTTTTFKALAVKAGMDNSSVATATYTFTPGIDLPFQSDFSDITGASAEANSSMPALTATNFPDGFLFALSSGIYGAGQKLKYGTGSAIGNLVTDFIRTGGVSTIEVKFNAIGWPTASKTAKVVVTYGTQTAEFTTDAGSWPITHSDLIEYSCVFAAIATPTTLSIASSANTSSNESRIFLDNVRIEAAPIVATPTFTPPGGNYSLPQTVTISCLTEGSTIYYTTNGTDPTTSSSVYSTPLNISVNTTIKALAVKAGMDNSSIATAIYTFPVEVPNIAAFKAANTNTNSVWYKITGDVTFVFRNGRNMYIKDATGGLLVYDNATPIITTAYNNGDIISGGVIGTYTLYSGLSEMLPVANTAVGTPGTPVEPITLTMENLLANFTTYESQLVKLEKVSFAAGTFATGTAANIPIYQNSSNMICRNQYGTLTNYEPGTVNRYDVSGFAIPFNTDRQLAPRDLDDIVETQFFTITLSANPTGSGTLTGGGKYYINDMATITASPIISYNFINWTEGGAEVTTNSQYQFTVTEDRTLVANFQIKTYTITSSVSGSNGTISPLGTTTVNYGANETYTITPNPGYDINQVLVDGTNNTAAVNSGSYTFSNVTANHTIVASFKLGEYTLTLDPSTGTVSPTTIPVTYTQEIGSIPNATQPNCIFKGWFIDDTQIFSSTIWNYTSDKTAIAVFDYPIVASSNGPGTINPTGTVNYSLGDNVTYVCTPNVGAHIVAVVVDGVTVYTGNNEQTVPYSHEFEEIDAYHTINVTFAQNCYAINPLNQIGDGVTVTMIPGNCVPHGANVTFNFAADCYDITNVIIGGDPKGVITTYSITNVTEPLPLIVIQTLQQQYTITATPTDDPLGEIIPSGINTVNCGTDKTFILFTETGFRVKKLVVDDVSIPIPPSETYTFHNIREDHTIHAEFEKYPQYVITFSAGTGGTVYPTLTPNATGYVDVDSASNKSFTIEPATGYVIDKVYIDNIYSSIATQQGSYTFVNVTAPHDIYATFKPIMLTIKATADANGSINPSGNVQVAYGTNQTFIAQPKTGYNVSAVYVDGVLNPTASVTGVYTFENVQENHTISANFVKKNYQITTIAGSNGTITPENPTVAYGTNITLYFIPETGYKADQVLINGNPQPAAAQAGYYTFFSVSQNYTVEVTFTKIVYTITTTFTPGGTVIPAGIIEVEYDDHSPIYVFNGHAEYHVESVFIDGVNNPQAVADEMYRFMNVSENHTMHVIFKPDFYTIQASATQGGYINPAGAVSVPYNQNKTFTFAPVAGYKLVRVLVDGINNPDAVQTGSYVFFNVDNEHVIDAQFEKITFDVVLPNTEGILFTPVNGSVSPVEYGQDFMFTVELQTGYTQSNIVLYANNIQINPSSGIYTIKNIMSNQTITISGLEENKYTIVSKAYAGGNITPAGTFVVTHGDSKTFQITPNPNYKIKDVVVNGISEGMVESYTFHSLYANGKIEAYFETNVGIDENEDAGIKVFSHNNVVSLVNENLISVKQVEIIDMYGRVVWSGLAPDSKTDIILDVATGIYGVRIFTESSIMTTKVSITR